MYIFLCYIDFKVFRRIGFVPDCSKYTVPDVMICKVFPVMVMTLEDEGDILFAEEVDKRETFLYWHVA